MPSDDERSVSDVSDVEEEVQAPAEEVEDCSNSDVVTKYRLAAEIAQSALEGVLSQLEAGKDVVELCKFGDLIVEQRCAAIFKSKKIDKGVAFPTSISANEIICHFSPLQNESLVLKAGDWVKIDLGCHIDGYIAVVAHTAIVPAEGSPPPPSSRSSRVRRLTCSSARTTPWSSARASSSRATRTCR